MEPNMRSGLKVMAGLIGLVKPLSGIMCGAIFMGCLGNLMAAFLTILGGYGILFVLEIEQSIPLSVILGLMVVFAVLRGIMRYAEQASNHYIAFKVLARIRHQVFAALCRLAPAKLEGAEKGNLISILTSDIELLEVFYAHTISPIVIALITSGVMVALIGIKHPLLGVVASICYLIVGLLIPMINGKAGAAEGRAFRVLFGGLGTVVLDNLYGLEEILQYGQREKRFAVMQSKSLMLEQTSKRLKQKENRQKVSADSVIAGAGVMMAVSAGCLMKNGLLSTADGVLAVIAMMSSFGPVAALSSLSNNLHQTLASGNRVLNLLKEQPVTEELTEGEECCDGTISCEHITFGYEEHKRKILKNIQAEFAPNQIHGILGKSGCGKSTLLKLLMRFYETQEGRISYGANDVNHIKTAALRRHISYVTQDTFLFKDTIANNILVAKADAALEEIQEAAKKASIHDWIQSLPKGYETMVSELGTSLSGGERQRIGLARAFLYDSDVLLLDEPTSSLDSLNEGIILKSLKRERQNKTILLVSHRRSTMGVADRVLAL